MGPKRQKHLASRQPRGSQPAFDFDNDLFLSKEKENRYNSVFSSVKLHFEKWLSRDVLISNLAIVMTWLEGMGWFEYLCSSNVIYARLVKLFYANLESSTTCIANSFILGNPISITPDLVAETLGIPNAGITNFNDIGKTEALGICLEQPNVNPLMNVTSSHLPIASRIILLLVTNTFLPKEGSHTLPSERDLKFVACVKNGTPINLPYLIVNHLLSRPNHTPYPMLLSRIFETLNLDIPEDEQSVKPSHKQLVNKAGLRQFNIIFEDGEWVKLQGRGREPMREQANVRVGDDEDDDEDNPQQFEVRPSVGTSSSSSRPTLDLLQARMDLAQADIEYLKGRMDHFSEG
ncbi:hypothetical protein CFOL_v3_00730 [Cephalotus follicularis]|uniref:Putative plant transposon protein domain-containing protein n=1 Tax=Cephalotus follicularis TaxID=3775 RepID=A0A1Q3ANP8_CEPFO|nr:hypothetical protein CFOL_v3_00730 [Cephalotus follicularis]